MAEVYREVDVLAKTNRFNASETKDYFINPYYFGDDFASWIRQQLAPLGVVCEDPDQEDWGWYMDARFGSESYFLGIGATPEDDEADPNVAEWRVIVKKHRTILQRLTAKNRLRSDEPILALIEKVYASQPDFSSIGRECFK